MPSSSGSARFVGLGANQAAREDRLDLGAEEQPVAGERPVERLDAEAVAREQQAPPRRVPDREREHAAEALDAVVAPLLVGVDDRLGVASACGSGGPRASSSRPDVGVVVDLAVEDDPDRCRPRSKRLLAGGEIDDAQAPVAERRLRRRSRCPRRPGRDAR